MTNICTACFNEEDEIIAMIFKFEEGEYHDIEVNYCPKCGRKL